MTETAKISDLPPLTPPMTGDELLEIERSGTSYKVMAGDLAVSPPSAVPITTSAMSQDLDPLQLYYEITTGGTGDVELLNLPNLPLDGNGYNAQYVGRSLVVALVTQTDPGDSVKISVAGSDTVYAFQVQTRSPATSVNHTTTGVILNFATSAVAFQWIGDSWQFNSAITNTYDSTEMVTAISEFRGSPDARVVGGSVSGLGGNSTLLGGSGALQGGNAYITGGTTVAAATAGGDVHISGGHSTDDIFGNVLLDNLPTSDPHVLNALWNNSGALAISAGPP